uniref:M16 family metallopeptidase n=1 Tax=Chitinimonas sp. TaxID=1934313 RepID=UPI0035B28F57
DWALKMEADRMVNSHIARSDLDTEMTVVRNEMESGENNPSNILYEKMSAAAYQWHNYGKTTIGARADVENVNIAHLQAFYRNYYQPDNAVLIVTGKFDEQKTLERINTHFGAIPKPSRTLEPLWTVEPVQDGAREVNLSRVGDTQLVNAMYHIAQAAPPHSASSWVLSQIFGDTPTGRLHKALVEQKKAAGIGSWAAGLHDPGTMTFFVTLNKQQSRDEARRTLLSVVEDIKKQPISEAEVKRAKTALLNDFEKTLNDPVRFGVALSESIAQGDWRLMFLTRDRIEAVSSKDVQRVAENYLKPSNRTLGQFIPTDKPDRVAMPAAVDVPQLLASYQGKAALAAGEVFDPSASNIEKRTARTTLPNGMQLVTLSKQTRGNTVHGSLVLNIGNEKSLFGKKYIAEATADMLLRGAGKLNRQQIAERLDELKAKLSIGAQGGRVSVNFDTRRDKLPELLALLRDVLRSPTFPASELDVLKTELLTNIDEQRRQPEGVAQNALSRYDNPYPKGDIRYEETFDEMVAAIKALQASDVKAFHAGFYGSDHGELALVGDFDQAASETQLKQLFGDWKSKQPYARVANPYRATKAAAQTFETPDKANAFYIASLPVAIKDSDPDFVALSLANRVLGGGQMKNRLIDRLRQKEGISYGTGGWLAANAEENNSAIGMYAIYAPQNLDKLRNGINEEVALLIKDGITEQELAEAKSGMLQEATISRSQDRSLAAKLAAQAHIKRTMAWTAEQETRLNATTVAEVNAAIRKYIDPAHLVQMYAGDFANAAKKTADAK